MNILILEEKEKIESEIYSLNNRKFNHLFEILNVEVGSKVKAAILNGNFGFLEILEINLKEKSIIGKFLLEEFNQKKSILSNIRIFCSYQRPQTIKKIIQLISNLGVEEVFFFPCEKSEKSYSSSKIWQKEELKSEIILGLEQGKRNLEPKIFHIEKFHKIKDFFITNNRFVLDLNSEWIHLYSKNFEINPVEIILGSESGFVNSEIEFLQKNNCIPISISENTLRTEMALSFVLSQIELIRSKISAS